MSEELFEETLIKFKHREPFQPYLVELVDGRIIRVEQPALAIGGNSAAFITPDFSELVEFRCEEVRDIRLASAEAVS